MNTNDSTGLEIKIYPSIISEDSAIVVAGGAFVRRPGLGYYIKRLFTRKEYR